MSRNGAGISPVTVETAPFPGFPTDLQAQLMALMACAKGSSAHHRNDFENRFMHVQELARSGPESHWMAKPRRSTASPSCAVRL